MIVHCMLHIISPDRNNRLCKKWVSCWLNIHDCQQLMKSSTSYLHSLQDSQHRHEHTIQHGPPTWILQLTHLLCKPAQHNKLRQRQNKSGNFLHAHHWEAVLPRKHIKHSHYNKFWILAVQTASKFRILSQIHMLQDSVLDFLYMNLLSHRGTIVILSAL